MPEATEVGGALHVRKLTKDEILAIKAVYEGTADAFTQKLALSTIVNKFCRSHDLLWIPNEPDQTSFVNGRAFVGNNILRIAKVPIGKLIKEEEQNG